jgi:putative iron-dependent peroxidase
MGQAQGGIFAEGSSHHYFLEYDAADGASASAIREQLRTALSTFPGVPAGCEPHQVVGFGDSLWRELAPDRAPDALRPFRSIEGVSGHRAPATQHAIWFWIHGDRHDENLARALWINGALRGAASLALEERGFSYRDSRDLTGFIDGTANPKDDERQAAALVPDGARGAGGSFVLTQRWIHDLAAFHRLPVAEQERVIGRTKPDSEELVALELYRRSAPIGTVREHGLYFLAFARDPERFELVLESMFGASGDGVHDRLIEFSKATSGSFYFAPSQADLEAALA